ncbi:UNVERIFIED_CONTAM: hypothetical protein Sradi_1529800 [Sesamum radiatum]|uniref:Uncharacterized protein n=1 Tax=Sesamum radiatum TaxID=300843 RepID=A0AAW2UBX4_SESRA
MVSGRSRNALFHNNRDRFWERITGWNAKLLSQDGKGILVKAVLQAIPSYAISHFKFPNHLVRELELTAANFLWHNHAQGAKIQSGKFSATKKVGNRLTVTPKFATIVHEDTVTQT